ncbi:hypothetical protein Q0M07_14140, partial [Staphylococcus aureus]|nr:hypothetical protein [Staphylococcus aureus]
IDRVRNIKLNVEHQLKEEVQFKLPYQTDSTMYKYSDIEKTKMMNLNTSYGYIAAEDIVPYPPGIPVILKGENIRKEIVDSLLQWIDRGGRVEGIL